MLSELLSYFEGQFCWNWNLGWNICTTKGLEKVVTLQLSFCTTRTWWKLVDDCWGGQVRVWLMSSNYDELCFAKRITKFIWTSKLTLMLRWIHQGLEFSSRDFLQLPSLGKESSGNKKVSSKVSRSSNRLKLNFHAALSFSFQWAGLSVRHKFISFEQILLKVLALGIPTINN